MKVKSVLRTLAGPHFTFRWLRSRTCASLIIPLLLFAPPVVKAQFLYNITNATVTITGYTGSGAAVTIPSVIDARPVTTIGDYAFSSCTAGECSAS